MTQQKDDNKSGIENKNPAVPGRQHQNKTIRSYDEMTD